MTCNFALAQYLFRDYLLVSDELAGGVSLVKVQYLKR